MIDCTNPAAIWVNIATGRLHMVYGEQMLRWKSMTCPECGGTGKIDVPEPDTSIPDWCYAYFADGLVCTLDPGHPTDTPHEALVDVLVPGGELLVSARPDALLVIDHAKATASYLDTPGQTGITIRGPVEKKSTDQV